MSRDKMEEMVKLKQEIVKKYWKDYSLQSQLISKVQNLKYMFTNHYIILRVMILWSMIRAGWLTPSILAALESALWHNRVARGVFIHSRDFSGNKKCKVH